MDVCRRVWIYIDVLGVSSVGTFATKLMVTW